ncbi:MAG: 2-C-methyl-D-erythritol 4-phosphate cytidylyltransferase [Oscillospiraceae bacterium]|nr:2-C-methyl-D-erythritol 4-phosphate cytidylyltransferase [Oscillospiraceae bacterium]
MNYAVILSGGVGRRMENAALPKQYMEVKGKSVLAYTLEKFQNCPQVDEIVVVANHDWDSQIWSWAKQYGITKLTTIADPGPSRQESLLSGLKACKEAGEEDVVLVHDAARPLVSVELISRCVEALPGYDCVLPVLEMKDMIYVSTDGKTVTDFADRSVLFCGQSPEVFNLRKYLQLNLQTPQQELETIRGGCELAFKYGMKVGMISGEDKNFKLTTPSDMYRMKLNLDCAE